MMGGSWLTHVFRSFSSSAVSQQWAATLQKKIISPRVQNPVVCSTSFQPLAFTPVFEVIKFAPQQLLPLFIMEKNSNKISRNDVLTYKRGHLPAGVDTEQQNHICHFQLVRFSIMIWECIRSSEHDTEFSPLKCHPIFIIPIHKLIQFFLTSSVPAKKLPWYILWQDDWGFLNKGNATNQI